MDLDHLLTEARNPASADLDTLTPLEIVRLMSAEDAKVIPAVAAETKAIARAIEIIADRLRAAGRLVYVGAGTSGRLGVLDASECPPTFNSQPGQVIGLIAGGYQALTTAVEGAEDHPESAEKDLRHINLSAKDVLVGIATSGRTPYVLGALRFARSIGAFAIGMACVPDSGLASEADMIIAPLVGPEVLTGSTRLKAGTATKLVLNMLTTGAMVRLGKTFGNLMVDLRATNVKLKARTNRIVRHLVGLDVAAADELLASCGGELKTALVVGRSGLSPDEARQRLAEVQGQVGVVLAAQAAQAPGLARHVLGIDGGGTHTVALLGVVEQETVKVLGRGQGGPSNMKAVGPASAFAEIDRAVAAAFARAGVTRGPVEVACLGLAGAGRADDQAAVRAWAGGARLAEKVDVTGDMALPVALLPDRWGVAVVAGTGSSVWGRAADGRTARAGGWGPLLGDEGSAYSLVLGALRLVTRAMDSGRSRSAFAERLLRRMGLSDPSRLVSAVYGGEWDRTRLASLADEVVSVADGGDADAAQLVRAEAGALAASVAAVVRTLSLPSDQLPLALAGGLLLKAAGYRRCFLAELDHLGMRPAPVVEVNDPAAGAVHLAAALLSAK